ncbi:hypothetical protein [Methylorubrum extorquens]
MTASPSASEMGAHRSSDHICSTDSTNLNLVAEALKSLRNRVDVLEKAAKKPFYTDKSFWIGITTIPVIFASGWVLKYATDRPFLLREIHRLLGTEPALIAALDEKQNALKGAIQSLGKDRLLLASIFRVGLLQERAQRLNCSPDVADPAKVKFRCEVPQDALVSVADAPFTIGSAAKIDVGIIVNVTENFFKEDGSRDRGADKTNELESKQLIKVSVNGKDLTLSERSRWSPNIDHQGSKLPFAKYKFSCFDMPDPEVPDFPINTLSISLSNAADQKYSIAVGALIARSQEACDNKK